MLENGVVSRVTDPSIKSMYAAYNHCYRILRTRRKLERVIALTRACRKLRRSLSLSLSLFLSLSLSLALAFSLPIGLQIMYRMIIL